MLLSGSSSPFEGENEPKKNEATSPPTFVENGFSTKVLGNCILSCRSDFQGEKFLPNPSENVAVEAWPGRLVGNLY